MSLAIRQYAVAVLDVLGQKEAIRRWDNFSGREEDRAQIVAALKDSIGVRNGVGDYLMNFLTGSRDAPAPVDVNTMTTEQRTGWQRLKRWQIKTYAFSDTFVIYYPLVTPDADPSVNDLCVLVSALAATMQICNAAEHPVRGGIEIGWGLEWDRDEIYGPAFLNAYELEQRCAQYPRIVVGPRFVGYVQDIVRQSTSTKLEEVQVALASGCAGLVSRDEDGLDIVDYLGPGAVSVLGKDHTRDLVLQGAGFAKRERDRFVSTGDEKLAKRYNQLLRYYERNVARWL